MLGVAALKCTLLKLCSVLEGKLLIENELVTHCVFYVFKLGL